VAVATAMLFGADDMDDLIRIWKNIPKELQHVQPVIDAKDDAKLKFESARAE